MAINALQFKTSITCSGCVARVTPILNKTFGAGQWEVAVDSPDKVLIVHAANATKEAVMSTLKKVGFTAEPIQA